MMFAGRPELVLPPAPDTWTVVVLRWIKVCLVSAIVTQAILFVSVVSTEPRLFYSVSPLIPIIVLPVLLLGICLLFYCYALDGAERRYWTPERLRREKPALWYLYRASESAHVSRRPGSRIPPGVSQ
jgi:hypothetical protein